MAIASIELGLIGLEGRGSPINGGCLAQEQESIGVEVTTTLAVTTAHQAAAAASGQSAALIWRITTDDTAAYVAAGGTPDADALVEVEGITSARRLVPPGGTIELPAPLGSKVCVKAVV